MCFLTCICICGQSGLAPETCSRQWDLVEDVQLHFQYSDIQWQAQWQVWELMLLSCSNYHWRCFYRINEHVISVAPHWNANLNLYNSFSCWMKCGVIHEHMIFCRVWWNIQRSIINKDAEEYRSKDWPLWYTIFNSSFRRVWTTGKDTLYSIFKVWTFYIYIK